MVLGYCRTLVICRGLIDLRCKLETKEKLTTKSCSIADYLLAVRYPALVAHEKGQFFETT